LRRGPACRRDLLLAARTRDAASARGARHTATRDAASAANAAASPHAARTR